MYLTQINPYLKLPYFCSYYDHNVVAVTKTKNTVAITTAGDDPNQNITHEM